MIMKCFGSGSKGNCYSLMNDEEILILDAGIKYKDVLKGIDYRISDVVGVVVTHKHTDHSIAISDWKKNGVDVWQPYLDEEKQSKKFGNFSVSAFEVEHDGEPCRGFQIKHPDLGKLIYATDLSYTKYRFKNPNHIIVEANYSKDLVNKDSENWMHVLRGHMELQDTIAFIEKNNSESLKNVVLCHLSKSNANKDIFLEETKKVVNCPVFVADKGIEIEL